MWKRVCRLCQPDMCALYVCLICMSYMCAFYVCLICMCVELLMPYMCGLYVCLICAAYMFALADLHLSGLVELKDAVCYQALA